VASRGSLARQLSNQLDSVGAYPPALKPLAPGSQEPGRPLPMPALTYFNGIGGFSAGGSEYVIYMDGDSQTPAPWINVLANPGFGALIDETGQGCAWNQNSQLNRLTPWHNDPISPDSSAAVYIRDEESGIFWCPAAAPIRESEPYRIHHGQGYTRIEHNSHGIEQDLVVFVPVDDARTDPLRVERLTMHNRSPRGRTLTVTFYAEWVLGRDREETQLHVVSGWDPVSRALLARNAFNSEFPQSIAFAAAEPAPASFTADRMEFVGRNGSAASPAALRRRFLSGRTGPGLDPCAALQVKVEIEPGQKAELAFILGQAETIPHMRSLVEVYGNLEQVE